MSHAPEELLVESGDVRIAVQDFRGNLPPVVLLHGLGGSAASWAPLVPYLRPHHRIVMIDIRGHGLSDDAQWSFEAATDDVDVVCQELRLGSPLMVGHSLGGVLAAHWGQRHRASPGIINLDGHRPAYTSPDYYRGMDAAAVHSDRQHLKAMFDTQVAAMQSPIPAEAAQYIPARELSTRDGQAYVRVTAALCRQIEQSPQFINAVPTFGRVSCALLIVLAQHNLPGMPAKFRDLMSAYRCSLRFDLNMLTSQHPHIELTEIAASHAMVAEAPDKVAAIINGFAGRPDTKDPDIT